MADYSYFTMIEASNIEIMNEFVGLTKLLDKDIVANRLISIMNALGPNATWAEIAVRFNVLGPHKTSGD